MFVEHIRRLFYGLQVKLGSLSSYVLRPEFIFVFFYRSSAVLNNNAGRFVFWRVGFHYHLPPKFELPTNVDEIFRSFAKHCFFLTKNIIVFFPDMPQPFFPAEYHMQNDVLHLFDLSSTNHILRFRSHSPGSGWTLALSRLLHCFPFVIIVGFCKKTGGREHSAFYLYFSVSKRVFETKE